MFDYHMHTKISFDSVEEPAAMVAAAERIGLREICFTDHYDVNEPNILKSNLFDIEDYAREYDRLSSERVKIRRGVELGITQTNKRQLDDFLSRRYFDFVIGSVHYIGKYDIYREEYWKSRNTEQAFVQYLEHTLRCVRAYDNFDVLGHLTYASKSAYNAEHAKILYSDHSDICDEIMYTLAQTGKGMEINTSGVDRVGAFLPEREFIARFRELGGEIITVGSDAHDVSRVGQYIDGALEIARDVFGYVCTFEGRKPIYHKL
jgi:histidinol-phosphatase (PHP family)